MDHRDEFAKWLGKVEEALNGGVDVNMLPQSTGLCGCQDWKCQVCFPDSGPEEVVGGPDMSGQETCPTCGAECGGHQEGPVPGSIGVVPQMQPDMGFEVDDGMEMPMEDDFGMVDEEDQEFDQQPTQRGKDGRGVKLGDIIQKYVPVGDNSDGKESPLSYGEDNLAEVVGDEFDNEPEPYTDTEMANQAEFASASDNDIAQMEEMAGQIKYLQDMGLSKSPRMYSEADFASMSPSQLRACYQEVSGNNAAVQGEPTMENVDKDVAAMLSALKKYDMLTESVAPVLGMKMIGEKDEGKHNNGKETGFKSVASKAANEYGSKEAGERVAGAVRNKMKSSGKLEESDDDLPAFLKKGKADDKKANDDRNEKAGADVFKSNRDGKKDDKKDDVKESADPEVLEWMQRFSKLGNMKGYGR